METTALDKIPLDTMVLENSQGDKLTISPYAAHVLGWQTRNDNQHLFLSKDAVLKEGKAIRGGVPIIFPQFNEFGPGQRHGFARNLTWQITSQTDARIELTLCSNANTKALWPFNFVATYGVELGNEKLCLSLEVTNRDKKPFEFTSALHTYLAVSQLREVKLTGLSGYSYWNNDGSPFKERHCHTATPLSFIDTLETGIDRIYFSVDKPLQLIDGTKSLSITMSGFEEVVVWNPGANAAAQLADMRSDEYTQMLCVEAAKIDKPVTLNPDESWCGSQTLSVAGMS